MLQMICYELVEHRAFSKWPGETSVKNIVIYTVLLVLILFWQAMIVRQRAFTKDRGNECQWAIDLHCSNCSCFIWDSQTLSDWRWYRIYNITWYHSVSWNRSISSQGACCPPWVVSFERSFLVEVSQQAKLLEILRHHFQSLLLLLKTLCLHAEIILSSTYSCSCCWW